MKNLIKAYRKMFWEKMLDFFEYYVCILPLKIQDNLRWYGMLSTTSVTFSLMSTIYPTNKNSRRTQEYMMDLEYHMSDPSISRDNSCAVEVNVDNLIKGLELSFYTVKTWVYFTRWTRDFHMRKLFFSHLLKLHLISDI